MIEFADVKDFKYILKHLNEQKLDGKYVTVFDAKECRNAVLCLNCNERGHFIDDCPQSIIYSETVEEKSIGNRTAHSRGITIYEPKSSELQSFDEDSTSVNRSGTNIDENDGGSIKQAYPRGILLNTSNKCDNNSDSNSDGIEIQKGFEFKIKTNKHPTPLQTHSFLQPSSKIQISNLPQLSYCNI